MLISEEDLARFQLYVRPVPTPPGFTSYDIVRRAIELDDPPRIPYSFMEPLESDFVELAAVIGATGALNMYDVPKGEIAFDEWGVGWRSSGRLWGHADVCPLADLSALHSYQFPDVWTDAQTALARLLLEAGTAAGKYVMGADPIHMYERMRGLMGFENLMVAMYDDRERFEVLLDTLTDMTIAVVRKYADLGGVHGFMTWDDWGLQTNLQINPAYWRKMFKPRYARIVAACHSANMHYVLHSCGFIWAIIPDLIEIGVDDRSISRGSWASSGSPTVLEARFVSGTVSTSSGRPRGRAWTRCGRNRDAWSRSSVATTAASSPANTRSRATSRSPPRCITPSTKPSWRQAAGSPDFSPRDFTTETRRHGEGRSSGAISILVCPRGEPSNRQGAAEWPLSGPPNSPRSSLLDSVSPCLRGENCWLAWRRKKGISPSAGFQLMKGRQ